MWFFGPPCQGFSLMGKRALDDPRNELSRTYRTLRKTQCLCKKSEESYPYKMIIPIRS